MAYEGDAYERISTRIDQKLLGLYTISDDHQFISRIDNIIRMTCEAAYEPQMVSIGPYHRGKQNLEIMEKYKLVYLKGMLNRLNEESVGRYIDSLMQDEEEARKYYPEKACILNQEEFAEMMLLDGCFIIEFLRKYGKEDQIFDQILRTEWILKILCRDFLLFENQIPFFILVKLFEMTKNGHHDREEDLLSLAISCLNDCLRVDRPISTSSSSRYPLREPENIFHLLSLMYENWCSFATGSFAYGNDDDQNGSNSHRQNRREFSCITLGKPCFGLKRQEEEAEDYSNDRMFIEGVSELKQYGIKFGKSEQSKSWLDIEFENGEIKIPPLVIHDHTESILRNLIAYEKYMFDLGNSTNFITDYATFMDCLINTPMDVKELRVKGIIKNWLGDDKEVADMFNKFGTVSISPSNFTYRKIFKKVNEHCKRNSRISAINSWKSDLNNTYFKNPWSVISLLAAIFLLVLTLIQTIFSILQLYKKDSME